MKGLLYEKRVLSAMPSQTFEEGALDEAQQTGKLSYDGYKRCGAMSLMVIPAQQKKQLPIHQEEFQHRISRLSHMDDLNAVQRFQRDMDTFLHLHYLKSCCWWKLGWKSKR